MHHFPRSGGALTYENSRDSGWFRKGRGKVENQEVLNQWLAGLTGAGDGVFVVDEKGGIVLWNREAERILGRKSADAVKQPCYEIFRGKDLCRNLFCYDRCPVKVMAERGLPVQRFDLLVPLPGGEEVRLSISVFSLPSGNGSAPLIVHLLREVTPQREMHRAISRVPRRKASKTS